MKKVLTVLFTASLLVGCSAKVEEPITYDKVGTSSYFKEEVSSCYQIFPISYADSNGDGKGDINGITENLDYLSETLDVDCIWLTPVHESNSYHKYDVDDYYSIDSDFGTIDDYKKMLDEAENRGIKVLLDLVMNHTSTNNMWFKEAVKGEDNEYHDYYVWNDLTDKEAYPTKEGWVRKGDQYYFASFWDQMPELNYDNPSVRQEMKDIATFWLDLGVDGFRIDAVKHVYDPREYPQGTDTTAKNVEWFKEFNAHIKSINPDSFMVGEVWTPTSGIAPFYEGMDSAFDFNIAELITKVVNGGNKGGFMSTLGQIDRYYSAKREDYINSLFLANHDQNRIMSTLGNDLNKAKLAVNILYTLPGISWIYYGEELGMTGAKPDEDIREPFKWTDTQGKDFNASWRTWKYNKDLPSLEVQLEDPNSLVNHYRDLIALKKNNDILRFGDVNELETASNLLSYIRTYNGKTLLVMHNITRYDVNVEVSNPEALGEVIYSSSESNKVDGNTFDVKEYSTLIVELNDLDATFTKLK